MQLISIYKSKRNHAFTLVETLVALSVFSIAVLGVAANFSTSIKDTNISKKKIVATYLAQEGIEYMRNLRDTKMLYAGPSVDAWNEFLSTIAFCDESISAYGCYFDDTILNTPPNILACPSSCPVMYYHSASGEYDHTATLGELSGYIRKVQTRQVGSNEIEVTSTVYWAQGSGVYNVSFSEYLFNWM